MHEPTLYCGGCHCGCIRFSVQISELKALECNCSVCAAVAFLHLIVAREDFKLLSGKDDLSDYRFNTQQASHLFCRKCGVKSFYVPRSHPNGISVNVRCLDTLEPSDFEISNFDGRNWEENVHEIR